MKYFNIIIFFLIACSNGKHKNPQTDNNLPDSSIYYPYSPIYTSGYKTGNYQYLKTVTEFWKEFENGDLRKKAHFFAEKINIRFPEKILMGSRDSVLNEWKKMRDQYPYIQSFIYSWMPVKTKEENDDWVFIWGRQQLTNKEGKLRIIELHEIWLFDKSGKIIQMQQFHTAP